MKIQEKLVFSSIDALKSLDEKIAFASDAKVELLEKNVKSRTNMIKKVLNCSAESAAILELNLTPKALDLIMQSPNLKTTERLVHCANLMTGKGKSSTILTHVLKALKRRKKLTIAGLCAESDQCYSRVANAVKALAMLKVIDIIGAVIDKDDPRYITKMTKETIVSLNAQSAL